MDTEEEIAMLVTNIFSSETHRRLRISYEIDTPADYFGVDAEGRPFGPAEYSKNYFDVTAIY